MQCRICIGVFRRKYIIHVLVVEVDILVTKRAEMNVKDSIFKLYYSLFDPTRSWGGMGGI